VHVGVARATAGLAIEVHTRLLTLPHFLPRGWVKAALVLPEEPLVQGHGLTNDRVGHMTELLLLVEAERERRERAAEASHRHGAADGEVRVDADDLGNDKRSPLWLLRDALLIQYVHSIVHAKERSAAAQLASEVHFSTRATGPNPHDGYFQLKKTL
jgi:hypothetical protein